MGACGSKVTWETVGRDPMEDLRKRGRETGYFRDAPVQKDNKGDVVIVVNSYYWSVA